MRFKLVFSTHTKKGDFTPLGIVAIYDTYNPDRELWLANNNDQSIREGIKHFYIQDVIDADFVKHFYIQDVIDGDFEFDRDEYVKNMMNQLPKEDLSF